MTPKEKSEELIERFRPQCYCFLGSGMLTNTYDERVSTMNAKQCALIAVDQVLESIPPLITLEGFGSALFENDDVIWWNQVKQELEKL
jgi:hypothetical protein